MSSLRRGLCPRRQSRRDRRPPKALAPRKRRANLKKTPQHLKTTQVRMLRALCVYTWHTILCVLDVSHNHILGFKLRGEKHQSIRYQCLLGTWGNRSRSQASLWGTSCAGRQSIARLANNLITLTFIPLGKLHLKRIQWAIMCRHRRRQPNLICSECKS